MTSFLIAMLVMIVAFFALIAVWFRWRRQTGGGWGPQEFSDGSMTVSPTGYPEEMHGSGKKISALDNNAARL